MSTVIESGALSTIFDDYPVNTTTKYSKWETFSQSHTTMDPTEITVIKGQTWRDMKVILLEFEVQLTLRDGTPVNGTQHIYPENDSGHVFIKDLQIMINGNVVGSQRNEMYHLEN